MDNGVVCGGDLEPKGDGALFQCSGGVISDVHEVGVEAVAKAREAVLVGEASMQQGVKFAQEGVLQSLMHIGDVGGDVNIFGPITT